MNLSDKQEFAALINDVSVMYGRPTPSKPFMRMYFAALERFTLDDVIAGLNAHAQNPDNGQFFPKPADIIRHIEGGSDTRAKQAWTKVDRGIRCTGSYETVIFDDAIIHAVIADMGGWVELCKTSMDEMPFKQNEFEKRYRGYTTKPPLSFPRKLIGQSEAYNLQNNFQFAVPSPTVIGDRRMAALVYQGGSDVARLTSQQVTMDKLMALAIPANCIGVKGAA